MRPATKRVTATDAIGPPTKAASAHFGEAPFVGGVRPPCILCRGAGSSQFAVDCPVPRLTLLFFGAAKDIPEAAEMVTAGTACPQFALQANGQTRDSHVGTFSASL